MSHVVDIAVRMKDTAAIARACARLGWDFKVGQQKYRWHGTWVDDSPVPRNIFNDQAEYDRVVAMNKRDRIAYMNGILGKCDHAIRLPGGGEIGLIKKGDGYIPIWDWAGGVYSEMSSKRGVQDGGPLLQAYAIEAAKLEAVRKGYGYTEQTLENGTVKLTINQW